MKLVVVSPERDQSHEHEVLERLFAAGLERYHLRKPHASLAELEVYLKRISPPWRGRIVLHQHHELVEQLRLGGKHWPEKVGRGVPAEPLIRQNGAARPEASPYLTSRSCHDLATLRASLGKFDAVFFGPVFPSISKPGYAPTSPQVGEALSAILRTRTARERSTEVIAIGGIDAESVRRALSLGCEGVAVLGAIWQAPDPTGAFEEIKAAIGGVESRTRVLHAPVLGPGVGETDALPART